MASSSKRVYPIVRERVAARSVPRGDCLIWTGVLNKDGYGEIRIARKLRRVHRELWIEVNGPIAAGIEIDHACRNKACVNLAHLQAVSKKVNRENLSGAYRNSGTGIRGVHLDRKRGTYVAYVRHNGVRYAKRARTIDEAERLAIELRNRHFTNNLVDRSL